MKKLSLTLAQLHNDTRGANMAEYLIVLGLVALVALAGFTQFGTSVQGEIQNASTKMQNVVK